MYISCVKLYHVIIQFIHGKQNCRCIALKCCPTTTIKFFVRVPLRVFKARVRHYDSISCAGAGRAAQPAGRSSLPLGGFRVSQHSLTTGHRSRVSSFARVESNVSLGAVFVVRCHFSEASTLRGPSRCSSGEPDPPTLPRESQVSP